MILYHYIDNNFCNTKNINNNFKLFILKYLYKLIDNDKDYGLAVFFLACEKCQFSDKIYWEIYLIINKNQQRL